MRIERPLPRAAIAGAAVAVLLLAAFIVLMAVGQRARLWDDLVLDNRAHRVPCDDLPTLQQAQAAATSARARDIKRLDRLVAVDVVEDCPGRGSILITYGSRSTREEVERLLPEHTLDGVPVSLRNT